MLGKSGDRCSHELEREGRIVEGIGSRVFGGGAWFILNIPLFCAVFRVAPATGASSASSLVWSYIVH